MATFKLVVNLTARTTEFERSLKSLERDLGKLEKNLVNVGDKLTASLTVPILALGGAAGKLASDFDDGMSSMKALIGLTGEEVDKLKRQVLALAPAVAQSPKDLAESLTLITSSGQRGAQAMDTLRVSAKAAAAGLGETKDVADAATSVMNAYGPANISAAQAVSIFIVAAREGKTNLAALAPAMSGILPLAADLGVRFDEVAGTMAAMTRKGLEAGQASTGLRAVLATLVNPSAQARDALNSVGLTAEGLRSQLREKGLLSVLDTLRLKFAANEDALTRVFPSAKALSSILALMGKDAESTQGVLGRLAATTEGELNRAFKETENDASFRFRQGLEQMRVLGIQVGDTVLQVAVPAMRMFTVVVKDATTWYQNLSENTKSLILVSAGFAAILGPLFLAAGMVVGSLASMVSVGRSLIGILTWMAGLMSPLVAACLLLALSAAFIISRWEMLKESLVVIADAISEKFRDSLLGKVLGYHVTFFQKVGELLSPFGAMVKDGIGSGFLAAKDFATIELNDLSARAATSFQSIVDQAGKMSATLLAQFQATAPAITAPVELVTGTLAETQAKADNAMVQSATAWAKIGQIVDAGANSVQTTLAGLKAEMSDTGAAMQNSMRSMGQESARSMGAMTAAFMKGSIDMAQFVQQMIHQIMMLIVKILILKALTAAGMGGPFAAGFIGGMFAEGGRPPVGVPSLVGEKGPELFVPDTAGTIIPNSALGMSGGGTTIGSVQILIPDAGSPRATAEAVVDALNERLLAPSSKDVTLARRLGRADRLNNGRSA